MINKIWIIFIFLGITYGIITNNIETINFEILNSTKKSLNMILEIFPLMAMWMGLMNIVTKSGLLNKISNKIEPILRLIFKEIPKNHESFSLIATNIIANMFGLGNAATPVGIKAMKSLKELNNNSNTASNSMITFLILNTSGLTIIPTTIISLRMLNNSKNPTEIVIACIISTTLSTVAAIVIDKICRKVKYDK